MSAIRFEWIAKMTRKSKSICIVMKKKMSQQRKIMKKMFMLRSLYTSERYGPFLFCWFHICIGYIMKLYVSRHWALHWSFWSVSPSLSCLFFLFVYIVLLSLYRILTWDNKSRWCVYLTLAIFVSLVVLNTLQLNRLPLIILFNYA